MLQLGDTLRQPTLRRWPRSRCGGQAPRRLPPDAPRPPSPCPLPPLLPPTGSTPCARGWAGAGMPSRRRRCRRRLRSCSTRKPSCKVGCSSARGLCEGVSGNQQTPSGTHAILLLHGSCSACTPDSCSAPLGLPWPPLPPCCSGQPDVRAAGAAAASRPGDPHRGCRVPQGLWYVLEGDSSGSSGPGNSGRSAAPAAARGRPAQQQR